MEGFLEGAAHGHHFAHRLHLGGQAVVGGREFLEGKTWDFGDHVVDAGLKRCGGCAAGNFVFQLVQGVAHGQLGSHLGNREARGLGSQRRGAAHARVHLDHDDAAILGVDGKLHVGAAGVHTNFAQHGNAGIAQDLVLAVGQGLRRGHGDRVAGMHAHGVEVFDRADDDAVVRLVAHHFHLKLFPAQQRFFNQQLGGGRGFQAALGNGFKLFGVVGNAAAGAAQGEAGANHGGKAHALLHFPGFVHAVRNARAGRLQTNFGHGIFELQAVFGLVDGLGLGTNQLYAVFVQYAVVPQIQGAVQRRLSAHGGQDGIRALFGNDLLHRLPSDGLDVGHVRRGRVGHDGGGVAVDQDDFVALLAQGLAGLHAGIIELARLANDDGAGANDQNTFKVGALGHYFFSWVAAMDAVKRSNKWPMSLGPGAASGWP